MNFSALGQLVSRSQQRINIILHAACQRAGLRKIGWHTLRHTFASHLVMKGVPLKSVQELMRHATITMTMRYTHLSPTINREAVKELDELYQKREFMATAHQRHTP